MKPLYPYKETTQAMADAAPQMLDALMRLTHPMADDDDVEFARDAIARAKGLTPSSYEDVQESCRDKCAADALSGHFWANC